jgi:hypothetical protein
LCQPTHFLPAEIADRQQIEFHLTSLLASLWQTQLRSAPRLPTLLGQREHFERYYGLLQLLLRPPGGDQRDGQHLVLSPLARGSLGFHPQLRFSRKAVETPR